MWGRVNGGGRFIFLKPLAHSHWTSCLNINQTMSLHSIKPSSVFPWHCRWNPVSAVWPTGSMQSGSLLVAQSSALCSLPGSLGCSHTKLSPASKPLPWAVGPLAWKALLQVFSSSLSRFRLALHLFRALPCYAVPSSPLFVTLFSVQHSPVNFLKNYLYFLSPHT